jgi:diguanylate cyclase (GGDEF)-like protein
MRVVLGLPDKEAERKINDGETACRRWKRGEGVAGKVLESGTPIRVNDTGEDKSFAARESSNVRSILCVPLQVDGETIGVVNITNKKGGQPFADDDFEILGALADQAAVAIKRARLYDAAITDSLTQLTVRGYALDRLREEVKKSRRYKTPLSVVMCDIDHFKRVNDGWGHPAGDAVIRAAAATLKAGLRIDVDLAGRYGGEEFLLILPQTPAAGGGAAAERLRKAVSALEVDIGDGKTLQLTMSFGVAELRAEQGESADEVMKRADEALYASKEGGRNRVTVHGEEKGAAAPT